jgi:hypothetical protein
MAGSKSISRHVNGYQGIYGSSDVHGNQLSSLRIGLAEGIVGQPDIGQRQATFHKHTIFLHQHTGGISRNSLAELFHLAVGLEHNARLRGAEEIQRIGSAAIQLAAGNRRV